MFFYIKIEPLVGLQYWNRDHNFNNSEISLNIQAFVWFLRQGFLRNISYFHMFVVISLSNETSSFWQTIWNPFPISMLLGVKQTKNMFTNGHTDKKTDVRQQVIRKTHMNLWRHKAFEMSKYSYQKIIYSCFSEDVVPVQRRKRLLIQSHEMLYIIKSHTRFAKI